MKYKLILVSVLVFILSIGLVSAAFSTDPDDYCFIDEFDTNNFVNWDTATQVDASNGYVLQTAAGIGLIKNDFFWDCVDSTGGWTLEFLMKNVDAAAGSYTFGFDMGVKTNNDILWLIHGNGQAQYYAGGWNVLCGAGCVTDGSILTFRIGPNEANWEFLVDNVSKGSALPFEADTTWDNDLRYSGGQNNVYEWDNIYIYNGTDRPSAPPVVEPSLNLTSPEPITGSQFNTETLNINLSVSSDEDWNCTLNVNDVFNQTSDNNTAGSDIFLDYNLTFGDDEENTYTYQVICLNGGGGENTTTNTFFIDNFQPDITFVNPAADNTTLINSYYTDQLSTNIEIIDPNLFSYYYNVTFPNGTALAEFNNTNLTGNTSYNVTDTVNFGSSVGLFYADIEVCDGHTNNKIKMKDPSTGGSQFDFEGTKIHLKDKTDTENLGFLKKKDRYNFEFETKSSQKTKTFVVESHNHIYILDGTGYNGHLIMGNKWVDFEIDNFESVEITRINSNKVEVTVTLTQSTKDWNFNSIGELNCVFDQRELFVYNTTETFTAGVSSTEVNDLLLTFNYNSSFMTSLSANLTYNNTAYEATAIPGESTYVFNQTVSAPTLGEETAANVTFFWTYDVNGEEFNTSPQIQTVTKVEIDDCSVFTDEIINISLLNETDSAAVVGDLSFHMNYTLFTQNGAFSNDYTGESSYGVCIKEINNTITADLQMEYTSPNFGGTKVYYLEDITINGTTQFIDLFLTEGSTQVQFTVTDADDTPVPEVLIQVLSYDVGSDSTTVTEIIKTDSNGNAYAQIVLNTQFYQFILLKEGEIVLSTEEQKITSLTNKFRISLDEPDYLDRYTVVNGISFNLSYTNSTTSFGLTYADESGTVDEACIDINRASPGNTGIVNTTCNPGASGIFSLSIPDNPGSNTFVATSYVKFSDGEVFVLDSLSANFDETYKTFGQSGIFMTLLITSTLIGAAVWNPMVAVVLSVVAIFFAVVLKLFYLDWPVMVALIIIGGLTIYRLSKN